MGLPVIIDEVVIFCESEGYPENKFYNIITVETNNYIYNDS